MKLRPVIAEAGAGRKTLSRWQGRCPRKTGGGAGSVVRRVPSGKLDTLMKNRPEIPTLNAMSMH